MVEPITWLPSAALSIPAATAAAEPLLDPPGVRRRSCGLRVPRDSVAANSVVTVFPTMTAPASRSAATLAASRSERQPAKSGEPFSVGMSAVSMMSLIPSGIPSMGERGRAWRQRSVDSSAATRALKIEMHECTNPWLKCGEIGKAALEKIARCIGATGKARRGVEVRLWHEFELFFRRQHDDALRYLRPLPLARVITNGLHRAGATLRFGQPYSIT